MKVKLYQATYKGRTVKVSIPPKDCPYCHIPVCGSSKNTNGIRPIERHDNGCEFCNPRQKGRSIKAKIYQRSYMGLIDHGEFIDFIANRTADVMFPRSSQKAQAMDLLRLNLSLLVEAARRNPDLCKIIRDLFFSIQR